MVETFRIINNIDIAIKSFRKMGTPPEATSIKSTRSNVELILENTVSLKE